MPAKKPPPDDEKPQHERFIEAAREAGVDETGAEFEQAFAKIVPAKRWVMPDPSGTALAYYRSEITCPECGKEGTYLLRQLVSNDAIACAFCSGMIDLRASHAALVKHAKKIIKIEITSPGKGD